MNQNINTGIEAGKEITKEGVNQFFDNPFFIFVIKLLITIIVVGALIFISKIIANGIKNKIIKNNITEDEDNIVKIGNLIGDIIFYTLLIFDVFIGFEILGIQVGLLLGGISFGLGFAFKEILSNMIAGIILLSTRDYKLGDLIEIEGKYNYIGRIEEITIRYTIIRSVNNQKIIIPNIEMLTNPVKTFTSEEILRGETKVSISYFDDIEKAKKVIIEAINKLPYVINKEKTNVIVENFGDSGINLLVWFYFDPNGGLSYPDLKSNINNLIKKTLEKNNITIPYPHTVLTVDNNDKNLLKTILFAKKIIYDRKGK